jgi:integrase
MFVTKAEADAAISTVRSEQARGVWVKPAAGKINLSTYSDGWLARRVDLRPRTRELYERLLAHHIKPTLGGAELGKITPGTVRAWHAGLVASKAGSLVPAKSYRLLRTILAGAVEDELIARSPCTIKGAGVESSPERRVATVAEVMALAEEAGERYRALVLLATIASLRLGELAGLRRKDVDLLHGTITVVETVQTLKDGSLVVGHPSPTLAGAPSLCPTRSPTTSNATCRSTPRPTPTRLCLRVSVAVPSVEATGMCGGAKPPRRSASST